MRELFLDCNLVLLTFDTLSYMKAGIGLGFFAPLST